MWITERRGTGARSWYVVNRITGLELRQLRAHHGHLTWIVRPFASQEAAEAKAKILNDEHRAGVSPLWGENHESKS
jgi:hypothetical protein